MTFRPPSFSPSCARLGDFLYLTARRLCLFHSQYKHGRLFFALELLTLSTAQELTQRNKTLYKQKNRIPLSY